MTGNGRTAWRLSLSLHLVSLLPLLLALLACGRTSPLETKEALVAWAVLLCAGLWLGLRLVVGAVSLDLIAG